MEVGVHRGEEESTSFTKVSSTPLRRRPRASPRSEWEAGILKAVLPTLPSFGRLRPEQTSALRVMERGEEQGQRMLQTFVAEKLFRRKGLSCGAPTLVES